MQNNIRSPLERILQRRWPKRRIHEQLSSHSVDFISVVVYIPRFPCWIQRRLKPTEGPWRVFVVDPADGESGGTTGAMVDGEGGVHTVISICYSDGSGLEVD